MFRFINMMAEKLQSKPNLSLAYLDGINAVQAALDAGADPNSTNSIGVSILANASFDGRLEIVNALICKGADVNLANRDSKTTPLMMAVSARQIQVINTLLAAGADPYTKNKVGDSALSIAKKVSPEFEEQITSMFNKIKLQHFYDELITDQHSMLSKNYIHADLQYVISCFLFGYDTKPSPTPSISPSARP